MLYGYIHAYIHILCLIFFQHLHRVSHSLLLPGQVTDLECPLDVSSWDTAELTGEVMSPCCSCIGQKGQERSHGRNVGAQRKGRTRKGGRKEGGADEKMEGWM
jgi:hypothetical protein